MKYSRQRELIEQTVKSNKLHLTADEVYNILKPENQTLSLGTVYRNLNALCDAGIIKKISIPGGCDRFDGELHEHYHVVCTKCNKIFNIELPAMSLLDNKVKEETGVTSTSQQLIVYGICGDCSDLPIE